MKLSELISDCRQLSGPMFPEPDASNQDYSKKGLSHDPEITGITADSRTVQPGFLFIAVEGFAQNGHDYISKALEKGAAAVVAQKNPENFDRVILTHDSRLAMAGLAATFFGHPSKALVLVGITGTNGKTTTTWLLESIFTACGFKVGVMGTINIRYNGQVFDTPVTTPDAIDLQKALSDMKAAGVTHVIMEVSSHGLDLRRVDFCHFDAAVFTNLSQDHLDHHKTMEAYFNCKARLFTDFSATESPNTPACIINIDHKAGEAMLKKAKGRRISVSARHTANVQAVQISDTLEGLCTTIRYPEGEMQIQSSIAGAFNLENILCAAGTALALGVDSKTIETGIAGCHTVPGRLQRVSSPLERFVFVDYAHTPDALDSILKTLRHRAPHRLITVFGCGGDRGSGKAPPHGSDGLPPQ